MRSAGSVVVGYCPGVILRVVTGADRSDSRVIDRGWSLGRHAQGHGVVQPAAPVEWGVHAFALPAMLGCAR